MKNKTLSSRGSWIFQCTYVQYTNTKGMEGPRARSSVIDTTIFHFPAVCVDYKNFCRIFALRNLLCHVG